MCTSLLLWNRRKARWLLSNTGQRHDHSHGRRRGGGKLVGKMLDSMGYDVVCKNDGREAVDFYFAQTRAARGFAAMIFDLTIPGGIGGLEAIKAIRKSATKYRFLSQAGMPKIQS